MIRAVLKMRRMSKENLKLAIRMFFYLLRIEIVMLVFPYSIIKKLIFKQKETKMHMHGNRIAVLRRHINMLEAICRKIFWKPNCVRRAVVLRDSLVHSGIDAEIKIGAILIEGNFEAHAWVNSCGFEVFKNGDYRELRPVTSKLY